MVTLRQTVQNIKADFDRRCLLESKHGFLNRLTVLIKPGMVSVLLYRISRFCAYHRLKVVCMLCAELDHWYAKNEIIPYADLGPGVVFYGRNIGMTKVVIAGANCTFLGDNTLTLGGMEEYDSDVDRIVIGEYSVFGLGVSIIRPVELAAGTQMMHNSLVLLPESKPGATVSGVPARRRRVDSLDSIKMWNPIAGKPL